MELTKGRLAGFAPESTNLTDGGWTGWLEIALPQDVHSALLAAGRISDPRYGLQEAQSAWIERAVWVYEMDFELPEVLLQRYCLICEGLDTYCTIFVNDREVAQTDNMLIPHSVDISAFVRSGHNALRLRFDPLHSRAAQPLPEGFWINYDTDRAWARKAAFGFGWDWCARLATVGVWRPLRVEAYAREPRLDAIRLRTLYAETAKACVAVEVTLTEAAMPQCNDLRIRCLFSESDAVVAEGEATVEGSACRFCVTLQKPRRWWTWDMGEPFLYNVRVELLCGTGVLDVGVQRFGVRTIRLQTQSEQGESCFRILLNDVPLYSRGANWVPVENLLTLPDRTERVLRNLHLARQAHMNTICLWGGGIYEDDCFYEACDETGLLVWQYFMFACGEYPDDEAFTVKALDEVLRVVTRLGNHPCIAVWIGNVESQMLCRKIGLERPMHGAALFEKRIPELLSAVDATRPYLPTSPCFGTEPNSEEAGDRHNWDVWFKDIPFTAYREDRCLFASEFGVQACPSRETLERWLPPEELCLGSFGLDYLNKDALGPTHMEALLRLHIGAARTLTDYIDKTMLVQAEALRCAVEHYRHNMPRNGGALVWQLNDSWPSISWSVIDHDLIPKAAYYALRRAFAPVSVLLYPDGADQMEVCVSNATAEVWQGRVIVQLTDVLGQPLHEESLAAAAGPFQTVTLKTMRVGGRFYPNLPVRGPRRYCLMTCMPEGRPELRTVQYFSEFRFECLPKARLEARAYRLPAGDVALELSTDIPAVQVTVEGDMRWWELSDNACWLFPKETYTVRLHALAPQADPSRLMIRALNADAIPFPRLYP